MRALAAGLLLWSAFVSIFCGAQDASTSAIHGTVTDISGARVAGAHLELAAPEVGYTRSASTDTTGEFTFTLLRPATYELTVTADGLAPQKHTGIKVEVGGTAEMKITLRVKTVQETVIVEEKSALVETTTSTVSDLIDERAIQELPLNGRRFTDLALLGPGVTQDPRSLTSSSNGDLAFGGVRGFHTNFQVDGGDNNNSFFAQARGRYRAPYQFSNEVVQEYRVSSNTYGTDQGRSAGAVVNVVTKSGTNSIHGGLFYYLRDGHFSALHPFVRKQYADQQHQFGATVSGPIKKDRIFYFAGFDQHIFHVPSVVQFVNGTSTVTPGPKDYEFNDQALVFQTADALSALGGQSRSELLGDTGFAKLDAVLSHHQLLSARLNLSRFHGSNNVFFDPASPITNFAISSNGEEMVQTETFTLSLTSALPSHLGSHLRVQFSHDDESSRANTGDVGTRIFNLINGTGRSTILPRDTNEKRWQIAESMTWQNSRHTLKFGSDLIFTKIHNYFPELFGGQYLFEDIKVNPFTFVPQVGGLPLTPLRAFAHQVPRSYTQNFGRATSDPDANDYAAFIQDTVRIGSHLALSFGVRYDLQTFRSDQLVSNPIWPDSGKVPEDHNNFSPRAGFAATLGGRDRPLVLRGGFGIFYARIPSIYTSVIETENGLNRQHLFLDNTDFFARQVMPKYPDPAVACAAGAVLCSASAKDAGFLTSTISAFAHDFQTPYSEQASLTAEKEVLHRTAVSMSYLYVGGRHLIRARDANLPQPVDLQYPVFSDDGTVFTGNYSTVSSFADWQFVKSLTCPFPPCINPLQRPVPGIGAINVFASSASSSYNGFTFSAKRRVSSGLYFRLSYTWAQAIDDTQDALVAGRPAQVQNSFATKNERGRSTTDQRHRFILAFTTDPQPFRRDQPALHAMFNNWQFSGVFSAGSGRPITAKIAGDANRDTNSDNDRLSGVRRNAYTGPDYFATDARLTRRFKITSHLRMELSAETFNLFNRDNKRMDITSDGFQNTAAAFVPLTKTVNNRKYPGHFRNSSQFLVPTNAYAPRQIQFALRLKF